MDVSCTLSDFKNYLGQFFSGEQSWGNEISSRQKQKLAQAADLSNMEEYKQRLMELRRDAVAKVVAHEPKRLQITADRAQRERRRDQSKGILRGPGRKGEELDGRAHALRSGDRSRPTCLEPGAQVAHEGGARGIGPAQR
eukprot:SAG22_NODE_7284_length_755_cov_0.939024_1_plen_139_part_01